MDKDTLGTAFLIDFFDDNTYYRSMLIQEFFKVNCCFKLCSIEVRKINLFMELYQIFVPKVGMGGYYVRSNLFAKRN